MPDPVDILGVPRTDIIPGKSIPRATYGDVLELEEYFERRHLAKAGAAAVNAPYQTAVIIVNAATDDVMNGRFKRQHDGKKFTYGGRPFDAQALSPTSAPFMLYLLLRHVDSKITPEAAAALITEENEAMVTRGVQELFRYEFKKEQDDDPAKKGQAVTE
jgi:hypothetical protein